MWPVARNVFKLHVGIIGAPWNRTSTQCRLKSAKFPLNKGTCLLSTNNLTSHCLTNTNSMLVYADHSHSTWVLFLLYMWNVQGKEMDWRKKDKTNWAGKRGKCGKGWSFVKERTVTHTKCLSQNWCLSSFLTVSSSCYVINEINASWNQHLVFFRHASIVEKCLVLTNYTLSTNSKHTSLKYQLSLLMEAKQAQNG